MQNGGALLARQSGPHEVEFAIENVIAEDQDGSVFAEEGINEKCLRDSLRTGLLGVLDPEAQCRTVPEQFAKHREVLGSRNNQNFPDSAKHQNGKRVVDHRLVIDGKEVADDAGERIEPGAGAASQDMPLRIICENGYSGVCL
jgi:hypothetical protein